MTLQATVLRAQFGRMRLDPYEERHCRELYAVRFHPTVRRFMRNSQLIPYREHLTWTRNHLLGTRSTHLWLVRTAPGTRAIGLTQLKFDAAGDRAEIGVMFRDPTKHRLASATASAITLHMAFVEFACASIDSYVVPSAHHAIEFNVGGGFAIIESDREGMMRLSMSRGAYFSSGINQRVMARIGPRLTISAAA